MMKNIITNIFAKLALVAVSIVISAATSFGQSTSSLTFTSACGGSGTANDGTVWTVSSDAAESQYDNTKGIHYGTSKAAVSYLRLSTDDINGTITQIVVNASGASGTSAKLNATVGGNAFDSQKSLTGAASNYTLSGSASGEIIISLTQSSAKKAIYCKSVAVTYTSGGGSTTYTVTYDANGGTGTMTDSNSPYASGATVTVLSNTFSREGYSFSKWNTANDGNGQDYSAEDTFTISANTTLYAQWTSNAAATITDIDDSGITNTDVYTSTAAGSLSASVTAGGNAVPGAAVTWIGNNDAVATIDASTGVVTLVAAGTVTFTASYPGVIGTYQASSDTYEMTVTNSAPYEQPAKIEITPNYTFWGKTGQFSGSTYDELSGSKDNVTLDWTRGGGSTYANTTAMRFYQENELTFTAPTGYEIKSIELDVSGTFNDLGFSPEGWDDTNKVWSGSSETVTMSRPSNASSYATISKFTIIIGAPSTVTTPTISPADGTTFGNDGLDVTISAANGTIYYTLDGTAPTSSSSAYSEAIHITTTTTVKAIAVDGSDVSNVASATYTYVDPNAPGTQNNPYTVSQARAAIDAGTGVTGVYATGIVSEIVTEYSSTYHNISYNISSDGLTASDQLQAYRGKSYNGNYFTSADDIQVGDNVVVYGNLKKYNSTYEFDQNNQLVSLVRKPAKPATPTFSPAAGAVSAGTGVTISTTTDGATIYYTTDGNEPTTSSTKYTEPITVSAAMTIKAIAVKDAVSSDLANAAYTIAQPVATPTFSPDGGTYTSVQSVEISCKTEDATIYYTTNGDTPTTSSTEYTSAISVNENMTIKAIAVKDGMANSSVAEAAYTINIPSIAANDVTIAYDATSGEIAYTINNPTEATLTATCSEEWISNITVSSEKVSFTTTANTGNADRTATFTLSYAGAVDKTVTLTQEHLVVDYATLPFSYKGGKSGLTTGLSQSGLGSDYNSAPYLKFDNTGDYLILKINEQPGTLSFDIKGNGFSGGTFTVQASANGHDYSDVETYTSLSDTQSAAIDDLASNIRYIKWVYTEKISGNVALGNISLAKVDNSPAITPSSYSIDAPASENGGTLTVTYKYVVTSAGVELAWFESNGTTPSSEPAWVSAEVNTEFNVNYLIAANNTSEARSAYFKIYGVDAGVNDVYSNLITITQKAPDYAELPFSFTGGRDAITSTSGLSQDGLGSDYGDNDSKLKFDTTDDYLILSFNEAPGTLSFNIKGNSFSGGTFKVQTSIDGVHYTDLASYTELANSNTSVSFSSLAYNVRYIKWIYAEKSGGNVGIGNISLEQANADEFNITATANGGRYWATFYNENYRYDLPEGAQAFTMNGSKNLYLLGTGSVIPANTAVIIIADHADIVLTKGGDTTVEVSGTSNSLVGSNSPVAVSGISGTPYVMGVVGGVIGFYPFSGANIPAFKAYYVK